MNVRLWAENLKRDIIAIWIAARDDRTPIVAKIVAATTAAYALSPIDLIPDFIPVLGYLDDVIIVPLGIWLALRLVPEQLMTEFRKTASWLTEKPKNVIMGFIVVAIWLACGVWLFVGLQGL